MKKLFVVLAFVLTATSTALAQGITVSEKCNVSDEHEAVTYFLIDRSDTFENEEGFKQTLQTLHKLIQPAERLVVGVSTGKASETRVLADLVLPKKSLWESTMKIRAKEKLFETCLKEVENSLLSYKESHERSALLETLNFVAKVLDADKSTKRRVVLYSDMMQNSPSLSFYSYKEIQPEPILKKIEQEGLVWKFPGVEFYVAGTGTNMSDKQARMLEQVWTKYFEKVGGAMKFYGPILVGG